MMTLTPQPGVLNIAPYIGGESAIAGHRNAIKLASNENALGMSPRVATAMRSALRKVPRYPDGHCTELRKALALRHELTFDGIVCGGGSDELIGLLCRAYAGPGDEVVYTEHGFLMYAIYAKSVGATSVVAAETNLTADISALLKRVSARTRIVFLANPNNPTGTYLPEDALVELRRNLRDDILLVIDAAYAEYMQEADYSAGIGLVENNDNVVMTRTFSKIYGLAGLRCGWCYCPPSVADVLNRIRNPFNVSSVAQVAGVAALADEDFVATSREHTRLWRDRVSQQLRQFGFDVPKSYGNFILVRFSSDDGLDAVRADNHLKSNGIIVRRMEAYGLPDSLRISIGTEQDMKALIAAFSRMSR